MHAENSRAAAWQRPGGGRKWHRLAGQVYTVCHVINLYGSLGFLIKGTLGGVFPEAESTTKGGIYGGSPFLLTLWLYWLTGALSLGMGIFHIVRGEVQRHRSWMSINYGTTFGAGGLRMGWMVLSMLTGETMDRTNMLSVYILITVFLSILPCLYTSFAHRKLFQPAADKTQDAPCTWTALGWLVLELAAVVTSAAVVNQSVSRFPGLVGPAWASTPDLNTVLGGSNVTLTEEAASYAQAAYRAADPSTFAPAALLHAGSWSVALVGGPILLRRATQDPETLSVGAPLMATYLVAVVGILISTACTPLNEQLSLGSMLLSRPSATEGHFYRGLGAGAWNMKMLALAVKTGIFAATAATGDKTRAVEWALHSYGEVATYMLLLPATWLFQRVLPTYEDAFHHGFLVGGVGMPLIFYIVGIYVFASEVDRNISAKKRGLFASWRGIKLSRASFKAKGE